jgi:beclin 1
VRCNAALRLELDVPPSSLDAELKARVADSFVVVAPAEVGPKLTAGDSARSVQVPSYDLVGRIGRIVSIASGHGLEDPACERCMESIYEEAQRQLSIALEERRAYQAALALLDEAADEKDYEAEAAALEAELAELDQAEVELQQEEKELKETLRDLEKQEANFWQSLNEYQQSLFIHEEEHAAIAGRISYATSQLNRLKATNVVNDAFSISQDGPFGTINGMRLGRLHDELVPWDEVNAAWGHMCVLLDVLRKRAGVQGGCSLVALGSKSCIQVGGAGEAPQNLELYGSDGGLGRFFRDRRFDQAMAAFVQGVQEVFEAIRARDDRAQLPFKLDGADVGGFSVKLQFNQEERWTKALKFLLTDLKWLIAMVESRAL